MATKMSPLLKAKTAYDAACRRADAGESVPELDALLERLETLEKQARSRRESSRSDSLLRAARRQYDHA